MCDKPCTEETDIEVSNSYALGVPSSSETCDYDHREFLKLVNPDVGRNPNPRFVDVGQGGTENEIEAKLRYFRKDDHKKI